MMKKIKLEELKPGVKFTRAVYITPTNMLVGPNTPVKNTDIDRLKKWGIKEVETAGEMIEPAKSVDYYTFHEGEDVHFKEKIIEEYKKLHKSKGKFKQQYDSSIDVLRSNISGVRNKKLINEIKIFNIASDLISDIISNIHIYIYLASKISDDKDYLTYHQLNVAILSVIIGYLIKTEPKKLINLCVGALLHDIGMIKVPKAILEKKDKLTPSEFNFIKLHPVYGYKTLTKDSNFSSEIALIALQHHEQYDGNGYPRRLKTDQIDIFSKIVAIADAFDAMTKKRSYRDEFLSYEAMKNLLSQSKNKFDPNLLRVFLSNMSIYPVASLVKLNTNAIGLVIGTYPNKPLRPILKIVIDEFGDRVPETEERFLDLLESQDIFITGPVDENQHELKIFDLI